jgi:hypothetical protein
MTHAVKGFHDARLAGASAHPRRLYHHTSHSPTPRPEKQSDKFLSHSQDPNVSRLEDLRYQSPARATNQNPARDMNRSPAREMHRSWSPERSARSDGDETYPKMHRSESDVYRDRTQTPDSCYSPIRIHDLRDLNSPVHAAAHSLANADIGTFLGAQRWNEGKSALIGKDQLTIIHAQGDGDADALQRDSDSLRRGERKASVPGRGRESPGSGVDRKSGVAESEFLRAHINVFRDDAHVNSTPHVVNGREVVPETVHSGHKRPGGRPSSPSPMRLRSPTPRKSDKSRREGWDVTLVGRPDDDGLTTNQRVCDDSNSASAFQKTETDNHAGTLGKSRSVTDMSPLKKSDDSRKGADFVSSVDVSGLMMTMSPGDMNKSHAWSVHDPSLRHQQDAREAATHGAWIARADDQSKDNKSVPSTPDAASLTWIGHGGDWSKDISPLEGHDNQGVVGRVAAAEQERRHAMWDVILRNNKALADATESMRASAGFRESPLAMDTTQTQTPSQTEPGTSASPAQCSRARKSQPQHSHDGQNLADSGSSDDESNSEAEGHMFVDLSRRNETSPSIAAGGSVPKRFAHDVSRVGTLERGPSNVPDRDGVRTEGDVGDSLEAQEDSQENPAGFDQLGNRFRLVSEENARNVVQQLGVDLCDVHTQMDDGLQAPLAHVGRHDDNSYKSDDGGHGYTAEADPNMVKKRSTTASSSPPHLKILQEDHGSRSDSDVDEHTKDALVAVQQQGDPRLLQAVVNQRNEPRATDHVDARHVDIKCDDDDDDDDDLQRRLQQEQQRQELETKLQHKLQQELQQEQNLSNNKRIVPSNLFSEDDVHHHSDGGVLVSHDAHAVQRNNGVHAHDGHHGQSINTGTCVSDAVEDTIQGSQLNEEVLDRFCGDENTSSAGKEANHGHGKAQPSTDKCQESMSTGPDGKPGNREAVPKADLDKDLMWIAR